MIAENAKRIQKILWHSRWMLLVGLMSYNLYSWLVSFNLSFFLHVHGFIFTLYLLIGLWESYFACKSSCKI
jgi:hypothetical protein